MDSAHTQTPPLYFSLPSPSLPPSSPLTEEAEEGGAGKHLHVLDGAHLPLRHGDDADGHDAEQIERGRTHDRAGAELSRLELVLDDFDTGEQDLRGRGAQSHQGQVGHGVRPDAHLPAGERGRQYKMWGIQGQETREHSQQIGTLLE